MGSKVRHRPAAAAAMVVAAVVGLGGCGRGAEFKDRTAVISIGGSRQTYVVDSCGRDGRTVFVVGRAPDGAIVQAVLGLGTDKKTGIRRSTGLTIDLDPSTPDTRIAAFGAEAWSRKGSPGSPPGSITSARLRGSRVQISGAVVDLDGQDQVVAGSKPERVSLDARCDLDEG